MRMPLDLCFEYEHKCACAYRGGRGFQISVVLELIDGCEPSESWESNLGCLEEQYML